VDIVKDLTRRERQINENKKIGEGEAEKLPIVGVITLEEALKRFVLVTGGKRVVDRNQPRHDLAIDEWKLKYRASVRFSEQKRIYVADEWERDEKRITVAQRTFKAGGGEFVDDPTGQKAINSWKDFIRQKAKNESLSLFLAHVEFLFPDEITRNRFLDWLAHIEQRPDVLPHTAWLHIATNTGLGRNWLASVLVRVWRGCVASNYNLVETLNSGFNGNLSCKILAIVDEIREGTENRWKHSEKVKSLITEEIRSINPKYGRQSIEFNSCRWLIFSNHISALPLAKTDRRIDVVINNSKPKGADYYQKLYNVLDEPSFINSVATYLKSRDISSFNAGTHAIWTKDKHKAARSSQSEATEIAELIVKHWPNDVITTQMLLACLNHEKENPVEIITPAQKHSLEDCDIYRLEKRATVDGKKQHLYSLRNHEYWENAETGESVSNATGSNVPYVNSFNNNDIREYLDSLIGE